MVLAFTSLLPGLFLPLEAIAHEACSYSSREDGIDVCQSKVPGSSFAKVRAESKVCTTAAELLAVLTNIEEFETWLPYVKEAHLLSKDANSHTYYVLNSSPWPMKPRDMVYQSSLETHAPGDVVHISIAGLPDYIAPKPSAVRLKQAQGAWELSPFGKDPSILKVTFSMHVEPGRVPATLANRRIRQTVVGALKSLRLRFPCD